MRVLSLAERARAERLESRPLAELQGVSKRFPGEEFDVLALDDVSLEIRDGEFMSIVGPSGCGKSTLLMLLAGLLPATSGRVLLEGKEITSPVTNIGIVFQSDVLLDWRTVLDNVMLQIEIRRLRRDEYLPRALALLDTAGLREFERNYPWQLSGGMRQRVSICRALVHNAPLLLMDEPFGALDAITRDQMNLVLQQIWDAHRKTVVFVTHSISESIFLSDRVHVMSPRPGRLVETVAVDLPRPRRLSIRETPEFASYARRIRTVFEATGVLSGEPA
jgi:NitT/TauT family transport system ATP-binding protein